MTAVADAVLVTLEDRRRWLEWRRGGIGGSDAAAIASEDAFHTPLDIWLDKTGALPLEADEDEVMRWGRRLEGLLVEAFEEETGLHVRGRQLLVQHPELPYLRATLDGVVAESPDPAVEPLGLFESKTASRRAEDWRDGLPARVEIQVQHNLMVTGLERAWVAVLLLSPVIRFRWWEVEADPAAQDVLLRLEQDFWRRVVDRDPPPAQATDLEALRIAYQASVPDSELELPLEAADLVAEYREGRTAGKAGELRAARAQAQLMAMLGEREIGLLEGRRLVSWARHERQSIDADALRARHPKLAKRFTKITPVRRFLVAGEEDNGASGS